MISVSLRARFSPQVLSRARPLNALRTLHQSQRISASFTDRDTVAQPNSVYPRPIISDFKSDFEPHHADISHAAVTTGIVSFTSLGISAPFNAIKALFDRLAKEPHLAARINATYPKRGVYKTAALNKPDSVVDQKLTIDLSAARLERLNRLAPQVAHELGAELKEAVAFFKRVEGQLVPQVMEATSAAAGFDMASLHRKGNNNYRLVDYFAKQTANRAPRCGVHRDYGTFSIILQNGASGGLEYLSPGSAQWASIPKSDCAVVWGWSSAILSGDRIHAAQHRVQATQSGSRRLSAVLFVAPDLDATLSPRSGSMSGFCNEIVDEQITVEMFKNISGKQWRVREGNEEGSPVMGNVDPLEVFVRSK